MPSEKGLNSEESLNPDVVDLVATLSEETRLVGRSRATLGADRKAVVSNKGCSTCCSGKLRCVRIASLICSRAVDKSWK